MILVLLIKRLTVYFGEQKTKFDILVTKRPFNSDDGANWERLTQQIFSDQHSNVRPDGFGSHSSSVSAIKPETFEKRYPTTIDFDKARMGFSHELIKMAYWGGSNGYICIPSFEDLSTLISQLYDKWESEMTINKITNEDDKNF